MQEVINVFDDNGDGLLQIDEFAKMWAPMMLEADEADDEIIVDDDLDKAIDTVVRQKSERVLHVHTPPDAPESPSKKSSGSIIGSFKAKFKSLKTASFRKASFRKRAKDKSKRTASVLGGEATTTVIASKPKPSSRAAPSAAPPSRGSNKSLNGDAPGAAAPEYKFLRSAADLQAASDVAKEQAATYEARAIVLVSNAFDRRLGRALVENDMAKQARAGEKQALKELIRSWDLNGDGEISKIEFRQACRNSLQVKAHNEEIDTLFNIFDADGSGKLELKELRPALVALQAEAAAADAEANSLKEMAEECVQRAGKLVEAAETMRAIRQEEKLLAVTTNEAQIVPHKLAALLVRRSLRLDDVVRKWPGVSQVPGEQAKVSKANLHKGLTDLKVACAASEAAAWFDEELGQEGRFAPSKNAILIKPVLTAAVKAYEEHRKEEGQRTKNLNAMRKQAKAQQTAIVTQEAAAKEAQSQAEEAAAKAAAERAAAEEAAKAAKMASFKRRKEKKLKEKEEFEARVKAKRESWTPLDDHFATTAGKAPTAAATPGEVRA